MLNLNRRMGIFNGEYVIIVAVLLTWLVGLTPVHAQKPHNVIVMIADDMSPFYLDPNHPVKMPNVKRLARRGTEFTNAHSALTSCGPSRMAFMTGRYPTTTNLFTFERWVPQVTGLKTIAQYLADHHGYETISFGKVFHEDKNANDPKTVGMLEAGLWTSQQHGGGSGDGECRSQWFCSLKTEHKSGDYRLSRDFIRFLNARNKSKPLLAFVGFRKPHLEVSVPAKFVAKRFPGKDVITKSKPVSLGFNQTIVPYEKSLQFTECYYEILARKIHGMKSYPTSRLLLPQNNRTLEQLRQYYFAASNFVDSLIGYVVKEVDSNPKYSKNTAFVFISDHGFANGEHAYFCKTSLFEQATRTAFVVAPSTNMNQVDRGRVRNDPVSLVDLFPTIVHLATEKNLPREAEVDSSGLQLDGRSVLQKGRQVLSLYTFSVMPRCNLVHNKNRWQCSVAFTPCGRIPNEYIGIMARTKGRKLVEWRYFIDLFTKCEKPNWQGLKASTRARLMPVFQIDNERTKIDFSRPPLQHELYNDLPTEADAKWGDWEKSNALVDNMNDKSVIVDALELSAAIRWKFDPAFAGATEPCNGNGYVRLVNRSQWKSLDVNVERSDVTCDCLQGFSGAECGNGG